MDKKAKFVMEMLQRQHILHWPTEFNCMRVLGKAMTRMTRIYSVAFPPIYNFACYHFPDYRIENHS